MFFFFNIFKKNNANSDNIQGKTSVNYEQLCVVSE